MEIYYLAYGVALLFSPLLVGMIPKVKAFLAGRKGPSLFQIYWDMGKLLRKGAVYSHSTTWVFRIAPVISLSSILMALLLIPAFGRPSPLGFGGDLILFAYLLAMVRFFTMLGAMDTGSSFEGMGASREALFSMLTEPALFLIMATLVKRKGEITLSRLFPFLEAPSAEKDWLAFVDPLVFLLAISFFVVLLVENYRIPVDDPTTHLELTMIHEVMVLDYSGPDLAYILYGSCLKFWIFSSLLVQLVFPALSSYSWGRSALLIFLGMIGTALLVAILESMMARLRLVALPKIITGGLMLAILAFLLER